MKVILVFVILVNIVYAGSFNSSAFRKTMQHIPVNRISKVLNKASPNMSSITKNINMKKLLPKDRITELAKKISKKSPFADKMMASKDPLYAITLYNRGGDKFFAQSDKLLKNTTSVNNVLFKKVKTEFPNFKFVKSKNLTNKFIDTLKKTGKFGVDITKKLGEFAIQHPKSAVAGILYGWFLTDPQGFKNALDDFGGNVQEFAKHIGGLASNVVVGSATGLFAGIVNQETEILTKFATFKNLFFIFILILILAIWKFRNVLQNMFMPTKKTNTVELKQRKKKGRF